CRYRIDVAEVVDVVVEGRAQLVELAVAGAVADQHLEAQSRLASLAQEKRDVRVVAGVEDDVGLRALELGHERGEVGGTRRISLLEHDGKALLLAITIVGIAA